MQREANIPGILLDFATAISTTSPFVKALLLVLSPPLSPVTLSIAVATTASSKATPTAIWLNATGLDLPELLITVLLFTLDDQFLSLPLGLRIQGEELLLGFLRVKLDEDTALEDLVRSTPEANGVCGTVWREEGLDVELRTWFLWTETLGIDATAHRLVFEDFDDVGIGRILHVLRQRHLTAHAGIVIGQFEGFRGLKSLHDGAEGLEAAHAFEGMNESQRDRTVFATPDLGKKELVHRKV